MTNGTDGQVGWEALLWLICIEAARCIPRRIMICIVGEDVRVSSLGVSRMSGLLSWSGILQAYNLISTICGLLGLLFGLPFPFWS